MAGRARTPGETRLESLSSNARRSPTGSAGSLPGAPRRRKPASPLHSMRRRAPSRSRKSGLAPRCGATWSSKPRATMRSSAVEVGRFHFGTSLDQPGEVRPLGDLELRQHRIEHQRRPGAEERHHLLREGVAEARSRGPPSGQSPTPLGEAFVRKVRAEGREEALDLRSDLAATDRGERRGVFGEREILQARRAEEGGGGDLRPVVVLGRHPEDRDRRAPGGFEGFSMTHRCGGFYQCQERAAEEAGLLPADDDRGRRIGELRRELGGARMAVAPGWRASALQRSRGGRRSGGAISGSVPGASRRSGARRSVSLPASQAAGIPFTRPWATRSIGSMGAAIRRILADAGGAGGGRTTVAARGSTKWFFASAPPTGTRRNPLCSVGTPGLIWIFSLDGGAPRHCAQGISSSPGRLAGSGTQQNQCSR